MYKVWEKIEEILLEPGNSTVKIDLSEVSPYPPELLKIPMVDRINTTQFIEIIARNILHQQLELESSTWITIKDIYEAATKDPNLEIFLEMLFVTSKLDVDEYCKYYKKYSSEVNGQYFEKKFLITFLSKVKNRLTKNDILVADQKIMHEIKLILSQPSIISAYADGLAKLGFEIDYVKIKNHINNMQIYFCKSLGNQIQGLTLRNGIVVSIFFSGLHLEKSVEMFLMNMNWIKFKAWIITKCCHETAHFLARSFSNDFNFSSPKFCGEKDSNDEMKLFEFGRHIELRLFEIQPNWFNSSDEAAMDFINNALIKSVLPVIRPKEENVNYLVARDHPSLSFAGDIELIQTEGCLCLK